MTADDRFARIVSLACHDMRTPLATVSGFAHTLPRVAQLEPPTDRYVEMMIAAAGEIADLLEQLGTMARIESGRYEPATAEADSLELARSAGDRLAEGEAEVRGRGGSVAVDRAAAAAALHGLARCALRHGGLERVELVAEGPRVEIGPVTGSAAPVLMGDDLRDLGAAYGRQVIAALGGSTELEGQSLVVRLPLAPVVG